MPASIDKIPIDNEGSFSHSHDVVLQRLDTHLPYSGVASGRLKYGIDNFTGTQQAWNNSYALFVPPGVPIQHPDHAKFSLDPKAEAQRLGFKIVGHHADTEIISNGPGEPRIITKAVFTDPEVDQYASEGKLSLSTGFDATVLPEGVMSGQVVPNHVLYFLRNENTAFGSPATGNDAGAMVNNLSENTMAEDIETKGILTKILEAVSNKPAVMEPVQNVADPRIAELTAEIEKLTKERDALKAKAEAMDNLMAEQATAKKEAEWVAVKNLLKPGLTHKAEDEKALRESFEAAPAAFMIANVGNLQTAKAIPAQGAAAVANLAEDDDKPFDIVAARGRMNPLTGRFE